MNQFLLLVFVVILSVNNVECLSATKLVSGQVFTLQSQHDGSYLTAKPGGEFTRSQFSGSPTQKFTFTLVEGKDIWTLTPLDGANTNAIRYRVTYVGHGKYQFQNLATNLCLQANRGQGQEAKCARDGPTVRWFVDTVILPSN